MCKHIQKLQEYCIDKDLSVVAAGMSMGIDVLCGTCEVQTEFEGLGPEHPIHEVEEETE